MISDQRLQELIEGKDTTASEYGEGWTIVDNQVLIIYDFKDPPDWLVPILQARDEDGCTTPERIELERIRLEAEAEPSEAQEVRGRL